MAAIIKCIDIEIEILREFDFRQNLIVPNITNQMGLLPFETDMLVLTKSGCAYGFEIKTSKSDLRADFKKRQHIKINEMRNVKTGLERFYGKFKHFSYAVPEFLKEDALKLIPEFCGLYVYDKLDYPQRSRFYCERQPKKLFDYKWNEKERYQVARLGAMRIFNLKLSINSLNK